MKESMFGFVCFLFLFFYLQCIVIEMVQVV